MSGAENETYNPHTAGMQQTLEVLVYGLVVECAAKFIGENQIQTDCSTAVRRLNADAAAWCAASEA